MTVYPSKICSKCKLEKSILDFGKASKEKSELKSACKICLRKQGRTYTAQQREINKDLINKKQTEYRKNKKKNNSNHYKDEYEKYRSSNLLSAKKYYKKNQLLCIENCAKYRKNNPDKMKQCVQNWRKNNPNTLKSGHKKWMQLNKDHVRAYNSKRRAQKRNVTFPFTDVELLQRISIFGYKCAYCQGPFEHIDHVKPLSKGGLHCLSNLRPACASCNLSKHNKSLNEWLGKK